MRKVQCNLTEPFLKNLTLEEVKAITIIVGKNGTGKTFINKIIFFSSLYVLMDLSKDHQPEIKRALESQDLDNSSAIAQYIFNNTFQEPQEISGTLDVFFEYGTFSCVIEKGEISKVTTSYDKGVTEAIYPKYMSTTTRLFTSMELILALDKSLPNDGVLAHCKLYDLMHCKRIQQFAIEISTIDEDLQKTLLEEYDTDIVKLTFDEKSGKFYSTDSKGITHAIGAMGNGHQSIIGMMIGTYY